MRRKHKPAWERGPLSAREAAEVDQRNTLIRELAAAGESFTRLLLLTGLSRRQLRRVLDDGVASAPPVLTADERRHVSRTYGNLSEVEPFRRTDARHNGHFVPLATALV